jgi:4-amino-4-deoxy-L-arabinose transferase-like glycosyltransferase
MNSPNPALVSQREAAPLLRLALFILCAAYVLPGLFGRDPWKNADITAFGYIVNIAQGRTSWLAPTVGGIPADGALLPYWIGAVFVKLSSPWLDPAFAARVPYALLLALTLALTWYAAYRLARAESAQPLPFAFGGEAEPTDYARRSPMAQCSALIASLGLLQLGHETTPELVQLVALALYLYGLAASPDEAGAGRPIDGAGADRGRGERRAGDRDAARRRRGGADTQLGLRGPLAGSGWIGVGAIVAAGAATALGAWANRLGALPHPAQLLGLARAIAWFAWPAWLLALWTLWQWRRRLSAPHVIVPLACAATLLGVWVAMAGSDRALMLALPALAILAAFALPTLQRGAAAAIDWFSVFFFTIAVATGWLFYAAMQTGTPAQLATNAARLSPGYSRAFSLPALLLALAGTLAWLWLVRWRTGRSRHPLWKSLVLAAGGVSVCWLLVMTLLLPPLDNARSYRAMMQRVARVVPPSACIAAPGMPRAEVVALEYHGGYRVDAMTPASATPCDFLLLVRAARATPGAGWQLVASAWRNRSDDDLTDIYRRTSPR